ncbi:protein NTM1-like 9 [Corylus avellana]|uniref:protein NTM1-like 9 n=1 Tax=Corylus avellana TaxID=13451 RepID=UPI001E215605|nr:protein NTM1-like 9 [Corylus avellana]
MMAALCLNLELPRGFRFCPTDQELVNYFLRSKITGINHQALHFIPQLDHDFFKWEPWDLPESSGLPTKDEEWFFFSPRHRNGNRMNRATNAGYWKVVGKDQKIWSGGSLIGRKKILLFYLGSTSNAKITDWVMHEYHATLKELDGTTNPAQKTFVLCHLFKRPNNGSKAPKRKYHSTKSGPAKCKLALASESPAPEVPAEDHHPTTKECLHSDQDSHGMTYVDTIACNFERICFD